MMRNAKTQIENNPDDDKSTHFKLMSYSNNPLREEKKIRQPLSINYRKISSNKS